MATMASRAKITRLLSKLTHKTPSFASGFRSNGARGQIRVNPFGVSGFPLSSSAAPLESNVMCSKDYEDYRRSLYGGITHKALLVDAVGTLVVPSQPMAQIYRQIGDKYGVEYSEAEILNRYRWAYEQPWGRSRLRYVNDGRPFWQYIVSSSTGCSDSQYFEELYNYYITEKAWHLCDPDAEKVFKAIRSEGVKLAVVSNFDTRLRPLLRALNCDHWFDAMAVSAEVEAEKPNPTIFLKACELLAVEPEDAVHVGDDRRNDIWGARDAGCDAWLWGSDVHSFKEKNNSSPNLNSYEFAVATLVNCSCYPCSKMTNQQPIYTNSGDSNESKFDRDSIAPVLIFSGPTKNDNTVQPYSLPLENAGKLEQFGKT